MESHTSSCTESHTVSCTKKAISHTVCCTDVIRLAVQYIRLAVHYQNIMKQEGIKMSRTRKTYRLSDEAVQVIENRDKSVYPTATDFLEAKLLAPTENTTELLNKVSMQLDEIKLMVAQEHQKKIEEQKAFF